MPLGRRQYSAEELQVYGDAVSQYIGSSWSQLPRLVAPPLRAHACAPTPTLACPASDTIIPALPSELADETATAVGREWRALGHDTACWAASPRGRRARGAKAAQRVRLLQRGRQSPDGALCCTNLQEAEQYERVAGQEMLRFQADKALFDQLQTKYLQLHSSIDSSGARLPVPKVVLPPPPPLRSYCCHAFHSHLSWCNWHHEHDCPR